MPKICTLFCLALFKKSVHFLPLVYSDRRYQRCIESCIAQTARGEGGGDGGQRWWFEAVIIVDPVLLTTIDQQALPKLL